MKATKKEHDTSHLAKFCQDWLKALEQANIGITAISRDFRKNGRQYTRSETRNLVSGMSIRARSFTRSRLYRLVSDIFHSPVMRHRSDIAALRGYDIEFGLIQAKVALERVADKAPGTPYRPEFLDIANELCLANVVVPLKMVIGQKNSHSCDVPHT